MIYVLIMYLSSGYGLAMETAEFNSQVACENAIQELKDFKRTIKAVCVPKGEE